uniref:Uncharacterized protein n=1 Tax=uncultured Thiotrichaceae bacterium TaxID=298394 RepID=A0A6S6UAC9_9GAMM|nr:MAG: Unknown protein [uncultured Thiotrichaceae bacterium]
MDEDVVRKAFEELKHDDPNVVWCKDTTRYIYAECRNQAKNWNREYAFWLKGIQWMSKQQRKSNE